MEEGEFRLAQLCGLNIIINADDLEEVSDFYQQRGFFEELIALMESGIGLERAHMGIFTELGILYAKYKPEKLMEHLKLFSTRINIPRLIRVCEEMEHWRELAYLYVQYDEYDNAAMVMMTHSPVAWEHVTFKDVAVKVSSVDVHYKAIGFYLEEHPDLLTDLLKVIEARVDHARVVDILRKAEQLPLVRDYLLSVQKSNLQAVNEAVNELYIEEEDFDGLRESITTYVWGGVVGVYGGGFVSWLMFSSTCCCTWYSCTLFPLGILMCLSYHHPSSIPPPPLAIPPHHTRTTPLRYDNFDQLSLAVKLEKHELLEFRRIASFIYKKNLKWRKAVALAKEDKLYKVCGGVGIWGNGSAFGCWCLGAGAWVPVFGCWCLGTDVWVAVLGCCMLLLGATTCSLYLVQFAVVHTPLIIARTHFLPLFCNRMQWKQLHNQKTRKSQKRSWHSLYPRATRNASRPACTHVMISSAPTMHWKQPG